MNSKKLLKKRYLDKIKASDDTYIGVELEFPIVNLRGQATNIDVVHQLFTHISRVLDFEIIKYDPQGNPLILRSTSLGDVIMFEISYNTLEFAFAKAKKIQEVDERFSLYLTVIQTFLKESDHALEGKGVHPNWRQNDNTPIALPRYQMLMDYLKLGLDYPEEICHRFPDYGTYICGSQVQLDVSKANFIRVLNAFNKIESGKAYLFANSAFDGADWDTKISRDIFWENSMHGLISENIGVFPGDFKNQDDFLNFLDETVIFNAERNGTIYYFQPIKCKVYLTTPEIEAYDCKGNKVILKPEIRDFEYHRAYHYQSLTTRGTIEFRSVCAQPLDKTFIPIAFHVGLIENLDNLEKFLIETDFFEKYGDDYPALRRQFSKKQLTEEETADVKVFAHGICQIAIQGLKYRNYGEENYLLSFTESL